MTKRKVRPIGEKRENATLDVRVTRTQGALKVNDRTVALVALVAMTAMFMAYILNH